MADWSKPTTASAYSNFVSETQARDIDAITLALADPTNTPSGAIKFDRVAGKFQEWSGVAWVDRPLGVAGGGTGGSSPSGARAALGLGTISTQNANAVVITGGTISGITALSLNGDISFQTDNANKIGTNANRPSAIYIRSGLVVPVGIDKFVTS